MYKIIVSIAALVIVGCGSGQVAPPSYGSDDGLKIAQLIDLVNDEKSTTANLAKLFVKGAAPKDLKKYPLYAYEISGNPTVTGANASAKVKLRSERGDSKDLGERDWTFEKEGNRWKLKSAALP